MTVRERSRFQARGSVIAGFVAFAACGALSPVFPGDGDAGELTLALALNGAPHPTGYPLYVLLGHAWSSCLHALGVGWAHAANLWSAAGAGLSCGLLHALALRLQPGDRNIPTSSRALVAALPAGLLLGNRTFMREATVAEVWSWQVAVVLFLVLAALPLLRLLLQDDPPVGEPALRGRMFVAGLAVGTALSHHATSVFHVVAMILAILVARVRTRRLNLVTTSCAWGGAALPLLSWLHLGWRAWHPAAFQWPLLEPSWASVAAHATGRAFASYLGGFAPRPEDARLLLTSIAPLAIPGLAAVAWLAIRRRGSAHGMLFGALALGSLMQLVFASLYRAPDNAPCFLPVLVVGLLGLGTLTAGPLLRRMRPRIAVVLALAILVHAGFGAAGTMARNRTAGRVAAAIRDRWEALPFERGIVLWNSDHYTQLVILGLLEGRKPDIVVDNPAILTWTPARRSFQRRTGIDPLAGLDLRHDSELPLIAPNVARQGPLPVVDFAVWSPP